MGGGSIGALIARLVDSAKSFARAEIALARCTALDWFARAKIALALLAMAMVIGLAAITILLAALGMALAYWLGTAGGLAVAASIGLAAAALLAFVGVKRLGGMGR